ncbi:MAG: conserved hypothetical protein [Candidatus Desulfovibrio kirbyi]|uniref:Uncharacterized protein n=1 Tax=Candidatus Desulfovibrio kirbyi TaxID=2696086 RepID=A0A6L2R705_9BACT|nr:MAG: conserved hypothetical protein [Candidatus Desulfovibrio kirbyi]
MQTVRIKRPVTPCFDMEAFMTMSRETRLGGAVAERIATLWEQWLPLLNVYEIPNNTTVWLAAWLPEQVEKAVEERWAVSPSEGHLYNNLAQFLCMSAVQEILPEVEIRGCAPVPRPVPALAEALNSLGISYKGEGPALNRMYAVVTHYPHMGGCEICHLQTHCSKGHGQTAGIVLPGHDETDNTA